MLAEPITTVDLGRLVSQVSAMAAAGDDAERIDRIRHFEALKGAIAAAQMSDAVALAESRRAESAMRGESATRQRRALTAAAGEIALARRISPAQARTWVGNARILRAELPHTFAALAGGRTTEWRALLVARETAFLSRDDRARADRELARDLTALSDRGTEREARRIAQWLDPAGATERARNATKDRRVSIRPAPDTMCRLSALLPVQQGVAAYAALTKYADALVGTGRQGTDPDDRSVRTRTQVMADTLVERLTGQTRADDVSVEINLVMTDRTLFGGADEPASLPGYGTLPATISRDLALRPGRAARWIRRLYLTPDASRLMTMDATRRRFGANQTRFIRLRDHGTCRTPWCDAPARHVDHVDDWARTKRTSVAHGQGYCEACNYTKQVRGWRTSAAADGAVVTETPTGHRYTSGVPAPPGARTRQDSPVEARLRSLLRAA